jgi:hypothetical protein
MLRAQRGEGKRAGPLADWKTSLMNRSAQVFGDSTAKMEEPDSKTLRAKTGQLTLVNDFCDFWEHAPS